MGRGDGRGDRSLWRGRRCCDPLLSGDGKAITLAANGLRVWDFTSEWKLERTIGSPDDASVFADRVTALDFSPDGKTLAVGSGEPSRSGEIKLFDVASGEQTLASRSRTAIR